MSGVTTLSLHALRIILLTAYTQYMPYQFDQGVTPLPVYDFIVGEMLIQRGSEGGVSYSRRENSGSVWFSF